MGRRSTYENQNVYAAVGLHLSKFGSIKLQDIVKYTGVSIGSLYHEYGSREVLLARAWLDAIGAFHTRFLDALESDNSNAGEQAAKITPQFCREEKHKALILMCCRKAELISDSLPTPLKNEVLNINQKVEESLTLFAKNNNYSLEACKLGLVAFPLGAVRLYLPHHGVPEHIDDFVVNAFRAAVKTQAA